MKTTVRHNLIIFHFPPEWHQLTAQLRTEHGPSILLIRDRCRRELGFTVRYHKGLVPYLEKYSLDHESDWVTHDAYSSYLQEHKNQMAYQDQVHLDFYDPAQQTFFVLKYLNS